MSKGLTNFGQCCKRCNPVLSALCLLLKPIILGAAVIKNVPRPGVPLCSCSRPGLQTGLQGFPGATQTGNQAALPSQSSPVQCQRPTQHCLAHQWLTDGKQEKKALFNYLPLSAYEEHTWE